MLLTSRTCRPATRWSSSAARATSRGSRSTHAKWPLRSAQFLTRSSVVLDRGLKECTRETPESYLRLSGVRRAVAQVDGEMCRMRRVEFFCRGTGGTRSRAWHGGEQSVHAI